MATISEREARQIEAANGGGRTPVVFIHGLWLLAGSWQRWADLFEEAGYAPVMADWPNDPATVEQARTNPQVLAGKGVGQIADHMGELIAALSTKPAVVGHSFGGLIAQKVAGRGISAATVAVDEAEAKRLYEEFHVAAPGLPIFQAAMANLNPSAETRVDSANPDRGPLLIFTGAVDHAVPPTMSNAAYKKQRRNPGVTELVEMPNRGHSLTIDSGWREVAAKSLEFVKRFV